MIGTIMEKEERKEVFFPYYINQGRLLDIYAILNNGYTEYNEICTAITDTKARDGKVDIKSNVGFKLLNVGADISGKIGENGTTQNEIKDHKVQTVTSMLSIVKNKLEEGGYLTEITKAMPGSFVCIPSILCINSIKSLLNETNQIIDFIKNLNSIGCEVKINNFDKKTFEKILNSVKILFGGEEIVYQTDEFAIFGNIVDSNLYQSTRSDIIGTKINCLAKVKRVFPNGTELMKNTLFSKFLDGTAKQSVIDALSDIVNNEAFRYEAVSISEIHGKPVYELEIIALYQ